jgi:hypothetical protein
LKILDEKSRLFGIVNPVDLVAVIAVIALIFVVANVLFGVTPAKVTTAKGEVRAVIYAGIVRQFVPGSIKIGDPVNRKGGSSMGRVVDIKAVPAITEEPTAQGMLNYTASKIFTDVYITVQGKGDITPVSANIEDEQLRTNQEIDIQAPTFEATKARVQAITKVK